MVIRDLNMKSMSQGLKFGKNVSDNLRVYTCQCGNLIDRDLNASINIKNQGKLLLNYYI